MTITIFGLAAILVGLILLMRGSMTAMLLFAMMTTLMGGSSAIDLPALGGSSIPPANLSLVFLMLRAILPGPGQMAALPATIRANMFLIIFGVYGAFSAIVLPLLFARMGKVTPLRPAAVRELFETAPIHFSSQNITTCVYLLGTLAAGLGAYLGASKPGAAKAIVRVGVLIAIIHATLGFVSIVVAGTSLSFIIDVFRNGHYAMLDQSMEGLARMNGIWPEASGFAAYGAAWFIFMTELWLRDVRPRETGFASAFLGAALFVSTSSTAYVGLLGYCLVVGLRSVVVPQGMRPQKVAIVLALIFTVVLLVIAALALLPDLLGKITHVLAESTVNKTESYSGRQRAFWAREGLDAFMLSGGIGIGAGSFRSSSLLTAILGSMGVVGTFAFVGHLLRAFQPLRASTYYGERNNIAAVGAAASWTCLLQLMPAAVASPSPDPGVVWAMFTGIAIALRPPHEAVQTLAVASRPQASPRAASSSAVRQQVT